MSTKTTTQTFCDICGKEVDQPVLSLDMFVRFVGANRGSIRVEPYLVGFDGGKDICLPCLRGAMHNYLKGVDA